MTETNETTAEGTSASPPDSQCYCSADGVLDLLSRKYAIQVVCVVDALEPVRYGEIEDAFDDVSSSTLSTRLGELTDAGLLERERHDEIPPRVEYSLSGEGAALGSALEPLVEWARTRPGTK